MTMQHTVLVWDKPYDVSVNRKSKSVWIAVGDYEGARIEVKGSSKYPLAWNEPGPQHKIQGIVHFAFCVDDLDATENLLRNRGARFACQPTVLEGLGIRYFHLFDNDGNLIEFGQRLK